MTISTIALTVYVLMWPVIVAGVIAVIATAYFREWKEAREAGEDII